MSSRSSGRSTPVNPAAENTRPRFKHQSHSSLSSNISFDRSLSSKRWSAQSSQTFASVSSEVSSPPSTSYCPSTIFERVFADDCTEYSRPTSPEDAGAWSPPFPASTSEAKDPGLMRLPDLSPLSPTTALSDPTPCPAIVEDDEKREIPLADGRQSPQHNATPVKRLRRVDSHASLISVSGMDIHSTLDVPGQRFHLSKTQQPSTVVGSTTASVITRATLSNNKVDVRDRLSNGSANNERYMPLVDTFGNFKRVGGWLSTRWSSTGDLRKKAQAQLAVQNAAEPTISEEPEPEPAPSLVPPVDVVPPEAGNQVPLDSVASPRPMKAAPVFRAPGVNQFGGLPLLPKPRTAWMNGKLDEDALRECLEE